MASSSGREELAGSQSTYNVNVYSSLSQQPSPDSDRVACCYFKAKFTGKGALSASGQGILLRLPRNESTPLALITSHQLIPSMADAKRWLIGFDPKKKEFDLEKYLNSSQAHFLTCCGEENSVWENAYHHLESKCPMNGDFTVLLLGADMSKEIDDTFGDCLDILSIEDCMNYVELQQVMQKRSVANVYQRMPSSVVLKTSIILPQAVAYTNSLTTCVKTYQNAYSSFPFDTQLNQGQPFSLMGAPIMYTDPVTMKRQLLGMHSYLPRQLEPYGISLSHVLEILRSFIPDFCSFYPCKKRNHSDQKWFLLLLHGLRFVVSRPTPTRTHSHSLLAVPERDQ